MGIEYTDRNENNQFPLMISMCGIFIDANNVQTSSQL